jgi:diguanylate cyclase (GGDEF)-like protein
LAYLDLEETQAADLWRSVSRHRRDLLRRLGRDVGPRVAMLDYLLNVRPRVVEPTIIEANALEALRRDAISDALTGLYNRQYFDEALRREVERCQRYGVTSSLLLLDLDGFKQINDRYGHCIGDEVLRSVGRLILKHVRASDVPCRYGGDEFAMILSDTPQAEALTVADRIRADVQTWFESTPIAGHELAVSVSGGVATLPTDGFAAERLVAIADGALYDAKHAGANRIAAAPGSQIPAS